MRPARESDVHRRAPQVLQEAEEVGQEIDVTVTLARTIVADIIELSHGLTVSRACW